MNSDFEVGSADGLRQSNIPQLPDDQQDITRTFFEACHSGLDAGELCHNGWFTLLHSMSAIEVMDPKMDIRVQGARRVVSTTEAVSTGALSLGPFSDFHELIGIMDELLASTTNWLTGDSLAQSVFTCMYMHCTQLLRDPYLRAFCELLRRVIYQIRHIILGAGVFDEEDFYPSTHGMPLKGPSTTFNRFSDTKSLNDAVKFFDLDSARLLEHTRGLVEALRASTHQSTEPEDELIGPLTYRLEFVMKLLQFTEKIFAYIAIPDEDIKSSDLLSFDALKDQCTKDECRNNSEMGDGASSNNFWSNLSSICSTSETILGELKDLAKKLTDTVTLGLSSGQGRLFPKKYSYGLPGFDPFLNQTCLPSYIPRFVIIHDRIKAFDYFYGLTENLLQITQIRLLVSKWNAFDPRNSALHLLWAVVRQCGQQTHSHVIQLLDMQNNTTVTNGEFHPCLSSCLLSRALSCLLYCIPIGYQHAANMVPATSCTFQLDLTIQSWLALESKSYHEPLRTIMSDVLGLKGFLDILADHLVQIPRVYCLNRSRQRSALEQLLLKFPDLLDECWRVEWIMGIELAKKLGLSEKPGATKGTGTDAAEATVAPEQPPYAVPLNLSSYVCYYYYQLTWDYLVTGFQLDLYAAHEWVFIYSFMIELFRNMFVLMERFLTSNTNVDTDSAPTQSSKGNINARSKVSGKKKSKRNKGHLADERNKVQSNQDNMSIGPAIRPCGPGSELEYMILNCHRSLAAGTVYALRALQLDTGGDLILDCTTSNSEQPTDRFGDPGEIFARRLGIFLSSSGSPFFDPGGCTGAFQACKRYLTSMVSSAGTRDAVDNRQSVTTELYLLATRNFEDAQVRAQFAQVTKAPMLVTINQITKMNLPDDLFSQLFGTPDKLADLEKLATHNLIACRVLANCPDRRPSVCKSNESNSPGTKTAAPSFLSRSSPVQLDFSFLTSRTYPLIRLISTQSSNTTNKS